MLVNIAKQTVYRLIHIIARVDRLVFIYIGICNEMDRVLNDKSKLAKREFLVFFNENPSMAGFQRTPVYSIFMCKNLTRADAQRIACMSCMRIKRARYSNALPSANQKQS